MSKGANLRLRGSSEANTYKAPKDQEPSVDRTEGTQQTIEQSPAHANGQTLCNIQKTQGNARKLFILSSKIT